MNYVSLIIEFLRGRPVFVFWAAALTQAALWVLLPALAYNAPPGSVPITLAIGHEFQLGSYLGPPLAFWLGEAAFRIAGTFGVYVLAQACVVTAYWAVFTLGRAIVGTRHAVLAVLLMAGISAFTVPSPEFGPAVLAAPLWALALLHYWRAVGEDQRGYWFLLALDLGLLLLANYAGLILLLLLLAFTGATVRGRSAMRAPEPWIAMLLFAVVVFPHAAWLTVYDRLVIGAITGGAAIGPALTAGLRLAAAIVLTHLGVALLAILASGWRRQRFDRAPEIDRNPVAPFARLYVYVFALAPAVVAVALATGFGHAGPLDKVAPLVVLSGLALIVAAGDRVLLYREHFVSTAWLGLLLTPPLFAAIGVTVLPWLFPATLTIGQPARAEGQFFTENYQRRTGRPLDYVAGDERVAPLVALGAPSRPHVYFDWAPERSPWASAADIRKNGGILVWPATDPAGTPPASLTAQFPDLVAEVPRVFARPVQGLLPLIRLGWATVRPQSAP